ncbi:helix-turn-helix domain-containing protein [Salinirubellus salinus]|uniref:Helix-turn-helix domain-containing protein n=1 Tax=Salinirubellus salinus TaxID=1364945 RepID=A0A9E7UA05_9EURY|nr:helix-turn-helix domain-containing protein [Salinirubellus salinus]UWM56506.1 helix-turn-helix domain-containing protein [Salinirubellus salinus]
MKYLRLAVREPPESRNPMHTFVMERDEVTLTQLWNWSTTDEAVDVVLFRVVGDRGVYTAALEEVPFVTAYETVRLDEESFYAYVEHETRDADRGFREPFVDRRVLTLPPIEFASDGETRMEVVGRQTDVQAVVDGFPAEFEVRVDRIGSYEHGLDGGALLTGRQREAVAVALELGYYEVPRSASVDAVAAELGCAASTAADHLRKAQARLARQAVGTER